ncbi:MAG: BREX-1 system adenine-specific DNA-methyltransferase PglX [Bulleidia sp.]|nr:BREX-1 system adenine-specific DNA-methyltransferase PglX [Bulleidia sp.]
MNKSSIKNYAVWARNELIERVSQKAYEYGVTESSIPALNTETINGRLLSQEEKKQLNELIREVKTNGFHHVIEEVAYTWFNRFIALRFMEVNNYLPQRVRVFTNENNEFKPEILTEAIHIEIDGLDKQKVFDYIEKNNEEELYKYLLLTLCNDMNEYLPDMFTSIKDYKTLLFPNNLLREDSVLDKLVKDIDEEDWKEQVQIIGWLYQYYNSELKDIVMKKKNYTKDDIPAATQLFTPDWIVRYMTENSLGRLWVDGHPDFKHDNWKYYLEEAPQEKEVEEKLKKIREEHSKLKPEDIKVLEPCMGSGHILVYAFDVLMDIYRDCGWSDKDAAKSILENNLYGLEIDERAYHLAYFSLMMKARSYNRRILSKSTKVNVLEIREPSREYKKEYNHYLKDYAEIAKYLVEEFKYAKELGSITNIEYSVELLTKFNEYLTELKENKDTLGIIEQADILELYDLLKPLVRQAILLTQKYDVVITNPPYMAPDAIQKPYVQKYYPDSKSDLFAVFIEKCHDFIKPNAYQAMITMHSWMFLSSFEKLRTKLLKDNTIINMAHLGAKAFEEIGGEVVQTTTFIFNNAYVKNYNSTFKRLVDYNSQGGKENAYLNEGNLYHSSATNFSKIPGSPIAYWCNSKVIKVFSHSKLLGNNVPTKKGMDTGNNDYFIRLWYEISFVKFDCIKHSKKWVPYDKGGIFRKWYGNNDYVVNWENDGKELKNSKANLRSVNLYFQKSITWNALSSANTCFRASIYNGTFDSAGSSMFPKDHFNYYLGLMNSVQTQYFLNIINPTLNYGAGSIANTPIIIQDNNKIDKYVEENISLSKSDWDSFETSWDFKVHPLVKNHVNRISEAYKLWDKECEDRFNTLKNNEEELNRIFIDIYGLQDELTPEVEDKDVTVRKADLTRDIKSLISYAVGCMFGRYSLDTEGLAYAGGEWEASKYKTYIPDKDDIIPITDEEYFEDDIVTRFIEFVKVVYGEETLEENLQFIAEALGGSGNAREVIRNYFLDGFYKDHCDTYQVTGSKKRPIYWLFESGKNNGFKALVYIHRYSKDLIARMRTGYVHELQSRYRTQISLLKNQIDSSKSQSEKVKLEKEYKKIKEQLTELSKYEEKVHHYADMMIEMDLDDGVRANYAKFEDLLAKIK